MQDLLSMTSADWSLLLKRRDTARSQRERDARDKIAIEHAEREADLDRVSYTKIEFRYNLRPTPDYMHKWEIYRIPRHYADHNEAFFASAHRRAT